MIIVLDTETTGTDPWKNSVIQIGAVDFSNPENKFQMIFAPFEGAEITSEAEKTHKIKKETFQTLPKFEYGVKKFHDWLLSFKQSPITMAGYNISFDYWFITKSFEKANLTNPFDFHLLDLYSIAFSINLREYGLTKICKALGVETLQAHNALNDAIMTRNALFKILQI